VRKAPLAILVLALVAAGVAAALLAGGGEPPADETARERPEPAAEAPAEEAPEPAVDGPADGTVEVHVFLVRRDREAETPAAGAEVTLTTAAGPRTARTGRDGVARVTGVPEGAYRTSVRKRGYLPGRPGLLAFPVDSRIRVVLLEAVETRITILDDVGSPLPGARFHVVAAAETLALSEARVVGRSDDRGRFGYTFDGDDDTALLVTAEGFASERITGRPGLEELEVRLARGLPLAGRVVDDSGKPISGARVEADVDGDPRISVPTDEEGRFRIEGMRPGRIEVGVGAAGYPPTTFELPSPRTDARLVLHPFVVVAGVVLTHEDEPMPGAWLSTIARDGSLGDPRSFVILAEGHDRAPVTDERGRFRLREAPGTTRVTLRIQAEPSGSLVWEATAFPGRENHLRCPPTVRLAGRVLSGSTGSPIAALLRLRPLGPGLATETKLAIEGDGRIETILVDEPDARIEVRADGHAPWSRRLGDIPPAERESLDIVLEALGVLRVEVRRPDGKPARRGHVQAFPEKGSPMLRPLVAGVAELHLEAGTYRLLVHDATTGAGTERSEVTIGAGEEKSLEVTVGVPGTARIHVRLGGRAVLTGRGRLRMAMTTSPDRARWSIAESDVEVAISLAGPAAALTLRGAEVEDGALVLRGLRPGRYTVSASVEANRSGPLAFTIVSGGTTEVDLEIGR
jgi:hypothetical protein